MKVLHIISTYKPAYIYGGPVMSVSRLCELLAKRTDISIQILTTNANGEQTLPITPNKEILIDGVPAIYFKRITGDPHETAPQLWRYLLSHVHEYDIVHIHGWWNLVVLVSAFICVQKRKKIIISPRGMLSPYILRANNARKKTVFQKLLGRRLLSKSFYHATSEQEFEECKKFISGWKGFTIPNLIALPPIAVVKTKNSVFTIGFLSRIDPKKGLEFVFKAITKLPFPVQFLIVGDGDESYIGQLRKLAMQLGISDRIRWIGWRGPEEKFYELMNFDLFILSSFNENFANVVIETLYVGTPVCISRHVGLASFVENNNLGWITDLTAESLSKAISDAYFDTAKRERIEKSSRNTIVTHFAEEKVIAEYMDMYKTILHSPD